MALLFLCSCGTHPPQPAEASSKFQLLYIHREKKGEEPVRWTLHSLDPVTGADSGPIYDIGYVETAVEVSPDGRLAAWIAPHCLKVIDLETGREVAAEPVSGDPEKDYWEDSPRWSPDGSRLLFDCKSSTALGPLKIWNRETRRASALPGSEEESMLWDPAWSPDGRRIAFAGREIWSVETGKLSAFAVGWAPHWSLDGKKILCIGSEQASKGFRAVSIDSETGRHEWISGELPGVGEDNWPPDKCAWSPDGTSLVYVTRDGDSQVTILGPVGKESVMYEVGHDWDQMRWSPDGRFIAFTTYWRGTLRQNHQDPNASDIAVFDTKTHEIRLLTRSGINRFPSWIGVRR